MKISGGGEGSRLKRSATFCTQPCFLCPVVVCLFFTRLPNDLSRRDNKSALIALATVKCSEPRASSLKASLSASRGSSREKGPSSSPWSRCESLGGSFCRGCSRRPFLAVPSSSALTSSRTWNVNNGRGHLPGPPCLSLMF